jgi:hypothetical protein
VRVKGENIPHRTRKIWSSSLTESVPLVAARGCTSLKGSYLPSGVRGTIHIYELESIMKPSPDKSCRLNRSMQHLLGH